MGYSDSDISTTLLTDQIQSILRLHRRPTTNANTIHNTNIIISTTRALSIPQSLLELTSIKIIHRIDSSITASPWVQELVNYLPISSQPPTQAGTLPGHHHHHDNADQILKLRQSISKLQTGQAVVVDSFRKTRVDQEGNDGDEHDDDGWFMMKVCINALDI